MLYGFQSRNINICYNEIFFDSIELLFRMLCAWNHIVHWPNNTKVHICATSRYQIFICSAKTASKITSSLSDPQKVFMIFVCISISLIIFSLISPIECGQFPNLFKWPTLLAFQKWFFSSSVNRIQNKYKWIQFGAFIATMSSDGPRT